MSLRLPVTVHLPCPTTGCSLGRILHSFPGGIPTNQNQYDDAGTGSPLNLAEVLRSGSCSWTEFCIKEAAYSHRVIFLKSKADMVTRLAYPQLFVAMTLDHLVEPILTAMHRHAARLQILEQTNPPSTSDDFREASARVCENDIQNIVQPSYLAAVDAEPDPAKQVRALIDAQMRLKDLVWPRLPQVGTRPDDGYYSIFVEGSVSAARAVYAKISQEMNRPVLSVPGA